MKLGVNILKHRLFLLFLFIAAALWYVNRLGYNYKTEVVLPIELSFDYNSLGWVENPKMKVKCLIEAEGSEIMKYRFGITPPIVIPSSSLSFSQTSKSGYFSINEASMRDALKISQDNSQVLQILDTLPWIKISEMESATIPVKSNVEVSCEKQFMMVGQFKLQPSEIKVRAPKSLLDTLKFIQTERVVMTGQNKNINIGVDLVIPQGVISADRQVRYMVDITGYTELEYDLPVTARNLPEHLSILSIPSKVKVLIKVPLQSFVSDRIEQPVATINYNARIEHRSNMFKIEVENLPKGGSVTSIYPEYVELLFSRN